jgi:multiple sugar transport system substrate-binding protein
MTNSTRSRIIEKARGVLLLLVAILCVAGLAWVAIPSPEPRVYPQRKPVRFWHMWTANWKVVVERIATRFNESQDVYEVIPLSVPGSGANAKFLLSVTGGDPPDVMAQWNSVLPTWAESGLIIPFDSLMAPDELETFKRTTYPIVTKNNTYKGRIWGISIGMNAWACYYRCDHFREAGLDPAKFPSTMEELMALGAKLDRFDARRNLLRVGFLPEPLRLLAPVFGGSFYDWDSSRLTIDTPENLRALTFLVDSRKRLGIDNVLRFRSGLTANYGTDWPFITGAYSITIDGQWRVEQLGKFAPNLEYRTAPIPPPAGGKAMAGFGTGNYMVIPKGAHEVQGAWQFIRFWSGIDQPERAAEFYTWGGWLPLNDAIAKSPTYQDYIRKYPHFQTFVDLMPSQNMQAPPPIPLQTFFMDRMLRADDSANRGTLSPSDALKRFAREMDHEQQRRKEMGYVD